MNEEDERHPLDWYPGEPMPAAVEAMLSESDVVKLQGDAGVLATRPAPNTTTPAKEIVMPLHDTAHAPFGGMFARHAAELRRTAELLDTLASMTEQDARRAAGRLKGVGDLLHNDADMLRAVIPMTPEHQEVLRLLESAKVRRSRGKGAASRVYFLQCADCHLVKIGVSQDYRLRMDDLHRTTEHVLNCLGSFEGDRQAEAEVHAMFKADRSEGEWFHVSDRLLAFIRERRTAPIDMPYLKARRHRR